jgi:polar amino acid transport system permease protein
MGPGALFEPLIGTVSSWKGVLLQGALLTVQIAAGSFLVGLLLGMTSAVAKLWGGPTTRAVASAYTTVFRAIPELLLIILLYYAGSSGLSALLAALGFGHVEINGFATAVAVLGIVQGAYAGEIFRGAILAIPTGQLEAGRAFAFTPWLFLRRIILPAMLPVALPGLANLWVVLIKETSLISVIGFSELLSSAKSAAASTRMYFTFYCVAGLMYLVMTLASNLLFQSVERRFRRTQQAI